MDFTSDSVDNSMLGNSPCYRIYWITSNQEKRFSNGQMAFHSRNFNECYRFYRFPGCGFCSVPGSASIVEGMDISNQTLLSTGTVVVPFEGSR